MRRKVSKKELAFIDKVYTLWRIERGKSIELTEKDFQDLTFVMRNASKKADLAFRAGGVCTKNNRLKCKYLIFPGRKSTYWENGSSSHLFLLDDVRIFFSSIITHKPRTYHLTYVTSVSEVTSCQELIDYCHSLSTAFEPITLSDSKLESFFKNYIEELIRFGIVSQAPDEALRGWHEAEGIVSFMADSTIVHSDEKRYIGEDLDDLLPMTTQPVESILFAASIFSLLKPLLQIICKNGNINAFIVQICLNQDEETINQYSFWTLEQQIQLWCNYRTWPREFRRGSYPSKFRNTFVKMPPLLYQLHMGFPIFFFNYKKQELPDDPIQPYSRAEAQILDKKQLEYLCSANCLAVLVSNQLPPKNYPSKRCLTIEARMKHPERVLKRYNGEPYLLKDLHERINTYYISCMNLISGQPVKIIRKQFQTSFQKASTVLNLTSKNDRQNQIASILATLFFLSSTLKKAGQNTKRLNQWIQTFQGEVGVATLQDFAHFIDDLLQGTTESENLLFGQDQDGIYLYYHNYWDAFKRYCAIHKIYVNDSCLQFRHKYLIPNEIIQAQYKPSNGQYQRYDYRKKLNGRTATVLKVSRKILNYI